MIRQRLQRQSRRWHRILGPLIGIQLFFWALGGIYFSWFDLDNVHGEYERAGLPAPDLRGVTGILPVEDLLARTTLGGVAEMRFGEFLGRPVARIHDASGRIEMLDARTGESLSPITEAEARTVAGDDFAPAAEITGVRLVERKAGEYRGSVPAYRVDFGNRKSTHIYVAADSGQITARRNAVWRGFDVLWMLHILDFRARQDFNNWLLRIVSLLGMATILSGYLLWLVTTPLLRRGRARRGAGTGAGGGPMC